jgi:hypothetical protein
MMQGRSHFALVPLKDGDALVAGGEADLVTQASAEIYHPTTGRFTATSPMATPRSYVGAARLQDGRVLVVGGLDDSVPLGTAEVYDPTPGTWSETAPMLGTGAGLTATLLRNFTVLVTGFQTGPAAQVYDPAADTWTATSTPIGVGQFGVAVRLHDGDVLAAAAGTAAAGLYDPASGTWRATGSLNTAREAAEAVLLPSGDVLVAGGRAPGAGPTLASAEVYNPAAGTWQLTPNSMSKPRQWFTLTVLPTGLVLAAGGCGDTCTKADTYATTDVFYTGDGYWFSGAPMTRARHGASGVMLRSGDLLVAGGGASCCRVVRSAELYTPTFATPHPSSGAVGSSFELRGSGFDAFERVRLEWDFKPLAGVRTNAVGRFDVPLTVPAGSLGRHYINASGRRSFASAQAVFVVTASGPAGRAASSS